MTESSKEVRTMFDSLTDPKLPACERTMSRIHDEGMILLSGTEPTANALTVAAFHIINQKGILTIIRAEARANGLGDVKKASLAELEQLPYLVS
jgi:hypothetical protein